MHSTNILSLVKASRPRLKASGTVYRRTYRTADGLHLRPDGQLQVGHAEIDLELPNLSGGERATALLVWAPSAPRAAGRGSRSRSNTSTQSAALAWPPHWYAPPRPSPSNRSSS